jgi:hypothetical protein
MNAIQCLWGRALHWQKGEQFTFTFLLPFGAMASNSESPVMEWWKWSGDLESAIYNHEFWVLKLSWSTSRLTFEFGIALHQSSEFSADLRFFRGSSFEASCQSYSSVRIFLVIAKFTRNLKDWRESMISDLQSQISSSPIENANSFGLNRCLLANVGWRKG